jgi:hypothetical protein
MTIDPKEAATALSDIAQVEHRTHQSITYEHSSRQFLLWGVLVVAGYLVTFFAPIYADRGWVAVMVAGLIGSYLLRRSAHITHSRDSRLGHRLGYAQLALIAYGFFLMWLFWPLAPRQLGTLWPSLVMFCEVLAGLWLGAFYIILGGGVTLLIVVGYVWAGAWYPLWLAATVGGGLIASGFWLRRAR